MVQTPADLGLPTYLVPRPISPPRYSDVPRLSSTLCHTPDTMAFLDENRRANIEISWVPGHMGIEGNDRADELAKEATELKPATETTTITKLH